MVAYSVESLVPLIRRELTNTLFSSLNNDSVFYMKPDKLRRPLIFYFAHGAAVYANKMALAGLMRASELKSACCWRTAFQSTNAHCAANVDLFYQKVFETGVDEMSWDDMDEMQVCWAPQLLSVGYFHSHSVRAQFTVCGRRTTILHGPLSRRRWTSGRLYVMRVLACMIVAHFSMTTGV